MSRAMSSILAALVTLGCHSPSSSPAAVSEGPARAEESGQSEHHAAMRAILAADTAISGQRDKDPRAMALSVAIERYVEGLEALDYSACPADFARGFQAHRAAWMEMGTYLESFGILRGEMHDLFRQIDREDNPTVAEFRRLHGAIFSTWALVDQALADSGYVQQN